MAVRLAASMLCLQASIGALNDLVDARWDAGRKSGKPLPRGSAARGTAIGIWAVGLAVGLALSAPSGLATVLVAALGVACGFAYDLRLSRTALSWLPLALALPLLPIHAWLGATGSLPPSALALLPIGTLAGTGLALANGLVDVDRDRSAGLSTAVVILGSRAAWTVHAAVVTLAVLLAAVEAPTGTPSWAAVGIGGGAALLGVGALLLRHRGPHVRERGWEASAVGVAVLGASWLGAVASAAR